MSDEAGQADVDRSLRLELMRMDLQLTKQAFWETPRNIAILLATMGVLCTALGFKLGQKQPPALVIQVQPPPAR